MITATQADLVFKANKRKAEQFSVTKGFSTKYAALSEAIRKNYYQLKNKEPKALFLEHFEVGENPWTTEEGQQLATALFGPEKVAFVAPAWDLLSSLPYQHGWSRRPFRSANPAHYLVKKISVFHDLYELCSNGLHSFDAADSMRYVVYTQYNGESLSPLLACALTAEGSSGPLHELAWDIFQGEDEIGATTRALIQGLLMTDQPESWALVEKLLLAAQREEGLRQTIFETVDQSSYGAFTHFIKVILDNDLARFSAVIRGVDTWFGFGWEAPKKKTIDRALGMAHAFLDGGKAATDRGLASDNNMEFYVALWATGVRDVNSATNVAAEALYTLPLEKKIAALYLLTQTNATHARVGEWANEFFGERPLLDYYVAMNLPAEWVMTDELLEKFVAHAKALPKDGKQFDPGVFDWIAPKVTPEYFYEVAIRRASEAQLLVLAEDLSAIPSTSREALMRRLFPKHYTWSLNYAEKAHPKLDTRRQPWVRSVMHQSLTDRSGGVMATGVTLLRNVELVDEDVTVITDLLRRKGKQLRGALIGIILQQPDAMIRQFGDELLPAKSVDQRLVGLEVLSVLKESGRLVQYIDDSIATYRERPNFSKNEEVLLERFSPVANKDSFSLENGFGVIDYANVRPIIEPQLKFTAPKKSGLLSKLTGATETFLFANFVDAKKIHRALLDLVQVVLENATYEYTVKYNDNYEQTHLLGNEISRRNPHNKDLSDAEKIDDLPLAEQFKAWYESTNLNDFELFFTLMHCHGMGQGNGRAWYERFSKHYYPEVAELNITIGERGAGKKLKSQLANVISVFYYARADHATMNQFQVDLLEDILARWPDEHRTLVANRDRSRGEIKSHWTSLAEALYPGHNTFQNSQAYDEHDLGMLTQFYDLKQFLFVGSKSAVYPPERFHEVITVAITRYYYGGVSPNAALAAYLYGKGIVSQDELLIHGLHEPSFLQKLFAAERVNAKKKNILTHLPLGLADDLVTNLLRLELDRGDLSTDSTKYTNAIDRIEGADYLIRLNERLGKETLHRGYSYGLDTNKKVSFSALIKKTVPAAVDTEESFVSRAKETKVTTKRWLEIAMYAPQWAPWIGELLKIDNLESAVWWFHAHASEYSNDQKAGIVARYSPIEMADFREGAIDIDWFTEVYAAVGKKNWKLLHDAAKYVTDGNGHRQVKLYSAIMLGEVKITETLKKIKDKRDKVYVKGLGLVPLSRKIPRKDLLRRYELFQQFLHESKQFGNQRKESEKKAVQIGVENLARNAGYDDPVRFSWIMEGQSTQAIMAESVVEIDNVTVSLVIDDRGKADILVEKDGKSQKTIPAKLRKHKHIIKLKENKAELRKQYRRTLQSLEKAMVDGQTFTVEEIGEINQHPVVKTLLAKLVLFHPKKQISGFWSRGVLNDVTGKPFELAPDEVVRIAHPTDLYATVQWDLFQRYAFDEQLVQPFKQIFRELYLLTANEREEKYKSSRYQGNQIQVKKTIALLTGRGWTVDHDAGLQKVDYKRGVVASLYAMADWFSAAEIEAPTLEEVAFRSRKNYKPVALDELDPILFSETMRDVDLVVSVANAGQVDPEASHSSMEMRAALARESARLFRLDNVEVKERHLIIKGMHGVYSVHLGSGMVSKNGLQLGIIPVHSQHRGRIFLPFVDDDPKSAEIIAKMRLLAEDGRIQDPTVLAQLMR
ncbi:DUF4132 domain-containing protein [Neolewinella antarctica]|uniref:DUF4132 domain-containing protein n=1 Tax=Neolewinella antarctica TaxID=442734 RepID=A0ABX0XE36_9BACT|nr:DUF4132 domain-containing protein [Neolewinella antarctica]NJC27511.1 hypothetical protein [Neolewinella antarctica]